MILDAVFEESEELNANFGVVMNVGDGKDYVLTDEDKAEIARMVDAVSYSQSQSLTDEQKETARNNINAVDASLVVSSISDDSQIPNGAGVRDAINEITLHNCVRCDVEQPLTDAFKQIARENINAVDASLVVDNLVADKQFLTDHIPNGQAVQSFIEANAVSSAVAQTLSDSKKQIARTNIGAVSKDELDEAIANAGGSGTSEVWETIADITLEEAVAIIKINQDTDGQEFSLKRAKIIIDTDNTTNFYTATGTLMMGLMSADNGVSARSMFLYNFIPDTAGKYSRAFFEIELVDGMAFISGCCKNNLAALNNSEFASSFTKYSNLPFAAMNGIINNISVSTNYKNGFAIGTHIKILGVRA